MTLRISPRPASPWTASLALVCLCVLGSACGETTPGADADGGVDSSEPTVDRPDGWTAETHEKRSDPDYDRVFPETAVQRIDIVIGADTHAAMMANMVEIYGELGASSGGPGGGPGSFSDTEPTFFPVDVQYDDVTWQNVGMRFKGNSSLRTSWQRGELKLPFRLDFDEFEDDYPEIDDQRFFGFKKLTFSSGYSDASLIREKMCGELFRNAGLAVARASFYEVYLDTGDGPFFAGLYTMVEDLSDQFLDHEFGDESGNLYKPDGTAASWGSFSANDFVKKTNEDAPDWSDIEGAIDALHADRADPTAWRTELETHFDTLGYLRLLAVNQAVQNWDTYGVMTHNYYLYGDAAADGLLVWMPWDLNECMLDRRALSVGLDEVRGEQWPVIRYLLDDAVYSAAYYEELERFLDGAFAVDVVQARMQELHDAISPSVLGASGEQAPYTLLSSQDAFSEALETGSDALFPHVEGRHTVVRAAIASARE